MVKDEKERKARMKALRQELEEQIEADLREAGGQMPSPHLYPPPAGAGGGKEGGEVTPKRILEALLFSSSKPLTVNEMKKIAGGAPAAKQLEGFLRELQEEYRRDARSFELIEIAGGWQMVTRKEYAAWLAKMELSRKARQASQSALETLAVLAYKQPVTRAEIEAIRGVDVSGVLSTLLERGFIKIAGKKEVAGRPFLYGTTERFLEHFGLKAVSDLPPIGEIKTLIEKAVRKEEWMGDAGAGPRACPEENSEDAGQPCLPAGRAQGVAPT